MVRSGGLEPPRVLPHSDLNAARLPIPPRPHVLTGEAPYSEGFESCEAQNGGKFRQPKSAFESASSEIQLGRPRLRLGCQR